MLMEMQCTCVDTFKLLPYMFAVCFYAEMRNNTFDCLHFTCFVLLEKHTQLGSIQITFAFKQSKTVSTASSNSEKSGVSKI